MSNLVAIKLAFLNRLHHLNMNKYAGPWILIFGNSLYKVYNIDKSAMEIKGGDTYVELSTPPYFTRIHCTLFARNAL